MSLQSHLSSVLAVIVLSSITLPMSYAETGAGSGGGTPDVTKPGITVSFQSNCNSGPCPAPDPLLPYRTIFDGGTPFVLSALGEQRTLYGNAVESPALNSNFSQHNPSNESIIYFDTSDLVPKANLYFWVNENETDRKYCTEQMTLAACIGGLLRNTEFAPALISENSELRAYPTTALRYTFRTSEDYIVVKIETCVGNVWTESGYYFVKPSRDRIKDFS